jgi:hypothetical protein
MTPSKRGPEERDAADIARRDRELGKRGRPHHTFQPTPVSDRVGVE